MRSSQDGRISGTVPKAVPGAVSRPGLSWLTVAGGIEAARKRRDPDEVVRKSRQPGT